MSAAESAAADRYIGIWLPFLEAAEAGLWIFWIMQTEVLAVPRPALLIERNRLHSADGPAVSWPDGDRYFFWHGIQVAERVITQPETITVREVQQERNTELRRCLIQRYGQERYLRDSGATAIVRDEWGTLYRAERPSDTPLVMVQVTNSTPEPDGSYKDYFLRVPPAMRTPREAIAWTFGKSEAEYAPAVQS